MLPPHSLPSLPSPPFLHMHFPPRFKKNQTTTTTTTKSMVKQQETEFFCVPVQTAHSTVTEEKHWATWGQKASQALGASFHAHTWSPEHRNQHLCPGSKFHSCTTPYTNANYTKEGTQSINLPSPSSPKWDEECGPHLPVAIIITFCAWSDLPTWGYLQAWRTKQRWHSLPSLCVFLRLPAWCC